jgi:hypothetical protein
VARRGLQPRRARCSCRRAGTSRRKPST